MRTPTEKHPSLLSGKVTPSFATAHALQFYRCALPTGSLDARDLHPRNRTARHRPRSPPPRARPVFTDHSSFILHIVREIFILKNW